MSTVDPADWRRRVMHAVKRPGLSNPLEDLRSRLGCILEATYWDRGYDERIAAIRGMCDLSTDGMTPADLDETPMAAARADVLAKVERFDLAESICRRIHKTRWEYAALMRACDECDLAATYAREDFRALIADLGSTDD